MQKTNIYKFTDFRKYLYSLMLINALSYSMISALLDVSKGFMHGLINESDNSRKITNAIIHKIINVFKLDKYEELFFRLLTCLDLDLLSVRQRNAIIKYAKKGGGYQWKKRLKKEM